MTQNTSSAVMQQRSEPHHSLDDFPTPPWATRALCEWIPENTNWQNLRQLAVMEPAANRGHMVSPLREYFGVVRASDVHDYGAGFDVQDYLFQRPPETDWMITNPPFRLAEQFALHGLKYTPAVAMIVRSAFLEGMGRHDRLFSKMPPTDILQFTERVLMLKGRLVADGAVCPKLNRKVTSATAYSWLVWSGPIGDTRFHWIPPCRKQLEKPEDYI